MTAGDQPQRTNGLPVSDLCYTWLAEGMNVDDIFENLAGLNAVCDFPGKDLHKYTERLEKHYNFDVLPDLYLKFIEMFLEQ